MTGHDDRLNRRKVLECMTWAGTGVLWTIAGGVPHSLGLVDQALAAEQKGFTFLQISDSHMGFDKPANPNAKGTLEEAITRIKALPAKPDFKFIPATSHICRKNRSSMTPSRSSPRQNSTYTTCPANTNHRSGHQTLQGALRSRHQRLGLLQFRCQRRAFHGLS